MLLVTGDGPEKENLMQLAADKGLADRIIFTGFIEKKNINDCYRIAEVFVFASMVESQGLVVLEAMACGCAPIAGDIESLREWITPGVNGLLVELNKPQALADAITCIIQNPRFKARAAKENYERIKSRAEISCVLEQLDAFYLRYL